MPFPFGSLDIPIESFKIQPIRLKSGAVFEGYYNDKYHKHGYGILIEPNGMIQEGIWFNDMPTERMRVIDTDGQIVGTVGL